MVSLKWLLPALILLSFMGAPASAEEDCGPGSPCREALLDYRDSLDNIDAAILFLLAERFRVIRQVGELKRRYDLPPTDKEREQAKVRRLQSLAAESTLDPGFIERLWQVIFDEAVDRHRRLRQE